MPAPCRSHYVDHRIQRGQKTVAVNSGLEMLDKGHAYPHKLLDL